MSLFFLFSLTFYLPELSADNLGKQFGPRSGPTKFWAGSGSKQIDKSDGIPERIFFF